MDCLSSEERLAFLEGDCVVSDDVTVVEFPEINEEVGDLFIRGDSLALVELRLQVVLTPSTELNEGNVFLL